MQYCKIKKFTENDRAGKWWDLMEKKGDKKWVTMKHNGVLFPEEYKPLPRQVKILYDGRPVDLDATRTDNPFNITAEEGAVFMAKKLEQDQRLIAKNPKRKSVLDVTVFIKNFWSDWKKILGEGHVIKKFEKVDFSPLIDYISRTDIAKKADRKKMSKEEKTEEKSGKEEKKEIYGFAVVDGIRMPLANYTVQPPGLFIGHGKQPLRGHIKKRIQPKDITLNVSKANVPECYNNGKPCRWGDVVENRDVTWIANWKNPITDDLNYVWLDRKVSHWVCADDMEKFDKARDLGRHIEEVRAKYKKDLESKDSETRQLATAVYLLDKLAIRPGTEKDEAKESDTRGLTTLTCENITFEDGRKIKINFVGKSSIEFVRKFKVDPQVYNNLMESCDDKPGNSKLFPKVNSISLNGYLKKLLPDLTAKVFRTYKAGITLQNELDKAEVDSDSPVFRKKNAYDQANMQVAIALNHKNLTESPDKIEKIKAKIAEYEEKREKAKTDKQKEAVEKSISTQESKLSQAEGNIALSTSKVNYIDSRITVAWCKRVDMPIEKIYNKSQLKKFAWAMDVAPEWKF